MDLNSPKHFENLTDEEQIVLLKWCKNLSKIKSFNQKHTSYGLKHLFERSKNGFYITNGQFKGAMLKSGFDVKNKNDLNWIFNVSQRSLSNLNK